MIADSAKTIPVTLDAEDRIVHVPAGSGWFSGLISDPCPAVDYVDGYQIVLGAGRPDFYGREITTYAWQDRQLPVVVDTRKGGQ